MNFGKLLYRTLNDYLAQHDLELVPTSKSRETFEQEYAERSGITVEFLHNDLDRYAIPCFCDEPACERWQMVTKKEFDAWEASIEDVDSDPDA